MSDTHEKPDEAIEVEAEEVEQEPLFDDKGNSTELVVHEYTPDDEFDKYAIQVPSKGFLTKMEVNETMTDMVSNMLAAGATPLDIYIAMKQLSDIADLAMGAVKQDAEKDANNLMDPNYKNVVVSMRSFGSYWTYSQVTLNEIDKRKQQIKDLKDEIEALEKLEKDTGAAKKMSSGRRGLSIRFKEL